MDESGILARLEAMGLAVDDGMTIGSPFIPDGTTRIYDPETSAVRARGGSLQEAWEDLSGREVD